MHKIIDTVLFAELFNDMRLNSTDALVWLKLYRHRVNTISGHLRTINFARETFRRSVRKLTELGWAYTVESANSRSLLVVPSIPPSAENLMIRELERVRNEIAFVGEWLMKCILDLVVDDHDFRDNARPAWLVSGDGSGRFELDRWYRSAKVAFEFQGSQHYQPDTSLHAGINEFQQQQWRDNLKAGICARQGIRYVEIPANELGVDFMLAKLTGLLPLRPIQTDRPLIKAIANMCLSYVNVVNREERRRQTKGN